MKDGSKRPKNLSLPREGFARPAQVAHALGVSEGTVYNYVKKGILPEPLRAGSRCTRWPVAVIRKIIAEQGGTVVE